MPLIGLPSPPMAEVDVSLPARTPTTAPAAAGPSAPPMSLSSTLPLTVPPSCTESASALAVGRSSMMLTLICPFAMSPSVSVATTLMFSMRLLMPSAVGWASLSFRV
ncbi:hypothetical protein D9M71_173320 [compost metagenome]